MNKQKNIYFFSEKYTASILLLIFFMVGFNSFFNSLSVALGGGFPTTTFLFSSNDLFADYFKFLFSYPQSLSINPSWIVGLLHDFSINNPTGGYSNLVIGQMTHFHVTPLTTLFSLVNIWLIKLLGPWKIFVFLLLLWAVLLYCLLNTVTMLKSEKIFFFLSILISYPVLFFVTRGNFHAGITGLALLGYLFLLAENKKKYLALFLFSVAVNIRPNAIILIFALLASKSESKIKDCLLFTLMTGSIFLTSYMASHFLYSDYSFDNFINGLKIYHANYVEADGGLAYGSSLLGLFKLLFGYSHFYEYLISTFGLLVAVTSSYLFIKAKLIAPVYIFILCSLYTLCSSVFADYHLIVFFGPLFWLYVSRDLMYGSYVGSVKSQLTIVFFSSLLVLSPKNYIFIHGVSLQVIFNPFILVIGLIYLILRCAVGDKPYIKKRISYGSDFY